MSEWCSEEGRLERRTDDCMEVDIAGITRRTRSKKGRLLICFLKSKWLVCTFFESGTGAKQADRLCRYGQNAIFMVVSLYAPYWLRIQLRWYLKLEAPAEGSE